MSNARTARISRRTAETDISLSVSIDGSGKSDVDTGIGFFDHMLTLLARHSLMDLSVKAIGDLHVDFHHTVEDTGIVLGQALREALGDKRGIVRYGSAYLPMDETLARVAVDLSGRSFLEFRAPASVPAIGLFPFQLVEEFLRGFAHNVLANVHVEILYGRDAHHMAEAVFKGLARALDAAMRIDPRVTGVPSTKESL
ncbi:MAG: imidazoleglycerol-phosphate dehydratase HisB [Verrucomicrobiota bacterium]|jgi:imidazoleglycerol-phosphate dehydratase